VTALAADSESQNSTNAQLLLRVASATTPYIENMLVVHSIEARGIIIFPGYKGKMYSCCTPTILFAYHIHTAANVYVFLRLRGEWCNSYNLSLIFTEFLGI